MIRRYHQPVKIVLFGEKPMSLNKFYSGMHWRKRKAEADRVHRIIRVNIPDPNMQPFDVPVRIKITAYVNGKLMDASNVMVKLYEDGLKGWIIEDDSPEYVRQVCAACKKDKNHPRVEIEITPIR